MDKSNIDLDKLKNCMCEGKESTLFSCLFSLPPRQFALLSSLIGVILNDNLSANELNALGNFMVNTGLTILTAVAQEQLIEDKSQQTEGKLIWYIYICYKDVLMKKVREFFKFADFYMPFDIIVINIFTDWLTDELNLTCVFVILIKFRWSRCFDNNQFQNIIMHVLNCHFCVIWNF